MPFIGITRQTQDQFRESGQAELLINARQAQHLRSADVFALNLLEDNRVHRLDRHPHRHGTIQFSQRLGNALFLVLAGRGENRARPVLPLLNPFDVFDDFEVPLVHGKIGIGEGEIRYEDRGPPYCGCNIVQLCFHAFNTEVVHFRNQLVPLVAKSAGERASPVGFYHRGELAVEKFVHMSSEIRRWNFVEVSPPGKHGPFMTSVSLMR